MPSAYLRDLPVFKSERPLWQRQAACRDSDPSIFFVDRGSGYDQTPPEAKKLCRSCPVKPECLEHALAYMEQGYWAGTTARARTRIRRRRRQEGTPVEILKPRILLGVARRDLTDRDRAEIRLRYEVGHPVSLIAVDFGLSFDTCEAICRAVLDPVAATA